MIPILYKPNERNFADNGYGPLSDATSCAVTEEANGAFQLKMSIPASTPRLAELAVGNLILAQPNPYASAQPFRISHISKGLQGAIDVSAQHVAYDLAAIPVAPFSGTAMSASTAMLHMKNGQVITRSNDRFDFQTDLSVTRDITVEKYTQAWDLLGTGENTLVGTYGGQLEFDGWTVWLRAARGSDRGFVIAYGQNMTELTCDTDFSEVYTAVYGWGKWGNTTRTDVEPTDAGHSPLPPPFGAGYTRYQLVDLTSEFSSAPTTSDFAAAVARKAREFTRQPKVEIKVGIVPPGSRGLQTLEELHLWDTVTLRHAGLGIDTKAVVCQTVFDVLRERYQSVDIGNRLTGVATVIARNNKRIKKAL